MSCTNFSLFCGDMDGSFFGRYSSVVIFQRFNMEHQKYPNLEDDAPLHRRGYFFFRFDKLLEFFETEIESGFPRFSDIQDVKKAQCFKTAEVSYSSPFRLRLG